VSEPAPVRPLLVDLGVIVTAFLVAGVLTGVVWPQLVDPVTVTRGELGLSTGEVALAERFDNDGWYAVLAGGCGLVLGIVLTTWRRTHEVVTLLGVVAGAFLAAWLSAEVGTLMGPDSPETVLANAEIGATAPDVVMVSADAAYFVWPIAAVVGTMIVLWSPPGHRLLERPGRTSPTEDRTST
jgi:hypothetical protein